MRLGKRGEASIIILGVALVAILFIGKNQVMNLLPFGKGGADSTVGRTAPSRDKRERHTFYKGPVLKEGTDGEMEVVGNVRFEERERSNVTKGSAIPKMNFAERIGYFVGKFLALVIIGLIVLYLGFPVTWAYLIKRRSKQKLAALETDKSVKEKTLTQVVKAIKKSKVLEKVNGVETELELALKDLTGDGTRAVINGIKEKLY